MLNLTVGNIVQFGVQNGLRYFWPLLGATILWVLTLWIPYINVGTTIGLLGLVTSMARGEPISATDIFKAKHRQHMGEFFLSLVFVFGGVLVGSLFFAIPGMVIAAAWFLAPLLVLDKGLNPAEALSESNKLTYGKKWTIFGGLLLLNMAMIATAALLYFLGTLMVSGLAGLVLGGLFALPVFILSQSIQLGANAHVYGVLTQTSPATAEEDRSGLFLGISMSSVGAVALVLALVFAFQDGTPSASDDRSGTPTSSEERAPRRRRRLVAPQEEALKPVEVLDEASPSESEAEALPKYKRRSRFR